jgi:hypothetical protein
MNVVIELFSDPDFTLPRVIPGYEKHTRSGASFQVIGVLGLYPYIMEGRVMGTSVVRYVFRFIDGLNGNGFIEISKAGNNLRLLTDYDGDQKTLFESSFEKMIKRFSKKIDEEVRLERIKRKI